MQVAELYRSLQGEGLLAGTPSIFLRTSGCNLRCRWCDTPFTSWEPQGLERSVEAVLREIESLDCRHVVVTGGEPLLSAGAVAVCRELRRRGGHVTVETAGTVLPAGAEQAPVTDVADLMSISPKLSSSTPSAEAAGSWRSRHEADRRRDDVLLRLMAGGRYQLKFVIDSPEDLEEARAWLDDLEHHRPVDRSRVFLMPQGTDEASLAATTSWLTTACQEAGLRLAPRHHLHWFGHTRGT